MMSPDEIRSWLMRKPQPREVRLTTSEGEIKVLPAQSRFATWAKSIYALEPILLEAIGERGSILRVERIADVETPVAVETQVVPEGTPVLPPELAGDPQAALFAFFASCLAQAHQAAAVQTGVAFARLCDVLDRSLDRNDATEDKLDQAREDLLAETQARIQATAENTDSDTELLKAFQQGRDQANGAAKDFGFDEEELN